MLSPLHMTICGLILFWDAQGCYYGRRGLAAEAEMELRIYSSWLSTLRCLLVVLFCTDSLSLMLALFAIVCYEVQFGNQWPLGQKSNRGSFQEEVFLSPGFT